MTRSAEPSRLCTKCFSFFFWYFYLTSFAWCICRCCCAVSHCILFDKRLKYEWSVCACVCLCKFVCISVCVWLCVCLQIGKAWVYNVRSSLCMYLKRMKHCTKRNRERECEVHSVWCALVKRAYDTSYYTTTSVWRGDDGCVGTMITLRR